MSWSFSAIGKPAAVLAKAQKDMAAYKCAEPEETLKNMALSVMETAFCVMPQDSAVKVTAFGSMSVIQAQVDAVPASIEVPAVLGPDGVTVVTPAVPAVAGSPEIPMVATNNYSLVIEPIYGFVE